MAFGNNPARVDDWGNLMCKCGQGGNIHQANTTIFERGEDNTTTTVIAQNGKDVQVSNFPSADTCNPSPRRHGLIIEFECEQCHYDRDGNREGPLHRLAIFQHKGNTFVEWEE